jgi:cytochrome P450
VLQARLRTEARSLPLSSSTDTGTPLDADTLAALEKLPLLDGVLRETLRLRPPLIANLRMAACDTAVPLSAPVMDLKGVAHSVLHLREGDMVAVPIFLINRLKEVYGADADVWKYVGAYTVCAGRCTWLIKT